MLNQPAGVATSLVGQIANQQPSAIILIPFINRQLEVVELEDVLFLFNCVVSCCRNDERAVDLDAGIISHVFQTTPNPTEAKLLVPDRRFDLVNVLTKLRYLFFNGQTVITDIEEELLGFPVAVTLRRLATVIHLLQLEDVAQTLAVGNGTPLKTTVIDKIAEMPRTRSPGNGEDGGQDRRDS